MQSNEAKEAYTAARNQCVAAMQLDNNSRKHKFAENFIKCPKSFYSQLSAITKSRAAVSQLQRPMGLTETNEEAAEALRDQYSSVYSLGQSSEISLATNTNELADYQFSREVVLAKLQHLKTDKSAGIDDIPPVVYKECVEVLASPFATLFTTSHRTGHLPSEWKKGLISPIYKGGDRTLCENYRPVALLPIASKVMDSMIDDHIRLYIDK